MEVGRELFMTMTDALSEYGEYLYGVMLINVVDGVKTWVTTYTRCLELDSIRRFTSLINRDVLLSEYPTIILPDELIDVPVIDLTSQPVLDSYRMVTEIRLPFCYIRDNLDKLRELLNPKDIASRVEDLLTILTENTRDTFNDDETYSSDYFFLPGHPEVTALTELCTLLPIDDRYVADTPMCAAVKHYPDSDWIRLYEKTYIASGEEITNDTFFVTKVDVPIDTLVTFIDSWIRKIDFSKVLLFGPLLDGVLESAKGKHDAFYIRDRHYPFVYTLGRVYDNIKESVERSFPVIYHIIDYNAGIVRVSMSQIEHEFNIIPGEGVGMLVDTEQTVNDIFKLVRQYYSKCMLYTKGNTFSIESPRIKDYIRGFRDIVMIVGELKRSKTWYDGTGVYFTPTDDSKRPRYTSQYFRGKYNIIPVCEYAEAYRTYPDMKIPTSLHDAFEVRPRPRYMLETSTYVLPGTAWVSSGPLAGSVIDVETRQLVGIAASPLAMMIQPTPSQVDLFRQMC